MMYQNNMYANPGMMYGNNAAFNGAAIQKPRMANPLNEEELKALRQSGIEEFNLKLDTLDLAEAFCTHKDPQNGTYLTIQNPDGSCTCKRCHQTFRPDDVTPEYVQKAVDMFYNVLQTIKFLGVDLSPDVIRGYFGYIPYIKKVPQLYKMVNNSFNQYNPEQMFGSMQNANSGANMFNAYSQMFNPANQFYGMPQQQPIYNQQQAMMGGNPFYAQQQAPAYQAPYQQPMNMPQQPVAPAQQVVPQQAPVAQATPQGVDPNAQQAPAGSNDVTINSKLSL